MIHHYRRGTHALGITLALAAIAATPAAARPIEYATQSATTNAQSGTSVCSEACSGSGYATPPRVGYMTKLNPSSPSAEIGAKLPHNPTPHTVIVSSHGGAISEGTRQAAINPHAGSSDMSDTGLAAAGAVVVLLVAAGGAYATGSHRGRRAAASRA
jgi:hypothetical protein